MGEIIYFEFYPEPEPYSYKVDGKTHEGKILGEYKCRDERIEKFWFYGSMRPALGEKIVTRGCFMFKDGTRQEVIIKFNELPLGADREEDWVKQAEEFLKTIK